MPTICKIESKGVFIARLLVKNFTYQSDKDKFLNRQDNSWRDARPGEPCASGTYVRRGDQWQKIRTLR